MDQKITLERLICAILAAILICSYGCSKKESFTPVLSGGLGIDSLFVSASLVSSDSDWSALGRSATGMHSSRRVVVCNWRGYLSRGLLRFSSLPDSAVEIENATLFLYATRIEGHAEGTVVSIHELTDSLDQTNVYWSNMPGIGPKIAEFSLPLEEEDSVATDLTDIVSSWVKKEVPNLGLVIKIDEETAEEVMVEFASREAPVTEVTSAEDTTVFNPRPMLRIAYVDTASEEIYSESLVSQDTFADTLITPFESNLLVCGNGFPSRTFIKFDISELPPEATVTRAALRLRINLEGSSFDSITILTHAILEPEWSGFETSFGTTGTGLTTLEIDDLFADPTVRMAITPLVRPLVSRLVNNYGFLVKSVNEGFDLDFVEFFPGEYQAGDFAPTLEIHYVLPPDPWFERE